MAWSSQQEDALKQVKGWMAEKDNQVFRLFGYAGTGKTTLANEIAAQAKGNVLFGAFTGKAASVLRQKGCRGASTIHSMIYMLDEENTKGGQPEFILNEDSDVREAKLVIIDECSMVDAEVGKDLLSFGTKVLVLGDPAQLPPVKSAGFFTEHEPDVMLTEVHRQALGNPIIALSMKIREGQGLEHGTYGDTKIIARADVERGEVLTADQVIVGLNRTRQTYNERIRNLRGHAEHPFPVKGEKLICLRNDRQKGIYNGTLWNVDAIRVPKNSASVKITVSSVDEEGLDPRKVVIRKEFFTGGEQNIPWQEKRGTQEFTFGYALTCHKAQGSQWPHVMVFDESGAFRDDARRWLYTATTRSAERLTLVKG